MKFIYGKQDWKSFERGEENCYLMTNGLGGFSSLTMIGSCGRNDHAVLMACVHSPNHRYNMIHRLEEILCIGEERIHISSQAYEKTEEREEGYLCQTEFAYKDYPQWTYLVKGVEIVRRIVLIQGENSVGISYEIRNFSGEEATLEVYPHLQFVPKGSLLPDDQKFTVELAGIQTVKVQGAGADGDSGDDSAGEKDFHHPVVKGRIASNGQTLHFQTNGEFEEVPLTFRENLYYAYDACDGRRDTGRTAVNHCVRASLSSGETCDLWMVYGITARLPGVEEMVEDMCGHRKELREQAGFRDETAQVLSQSAHQFISYRSSTAKQTILAGFPFFEDWGRDTMIAMMGCCLATRRFKTAESILQTFMTYCKKGLMPNLFPEGKEAPGYNTVDASLLFILAVYEYYRKTQDSILVKSAYQTMKEIICWYEKGTDFGIRMDEDGLIMAGRDYDQVTWMDVRVGDILPTPRHGKPVEINAYWYNALCIMNEFRKFFPEDEKDYASMAEKVKESFEQFWNEEAGCLKDVLSGTKADNQIRCNQIWAVSLPFSVLPPEREKQVVEVVFRKLYTPYGLRTLDPADEEFHACYGGPQLDRDLAYHQGTVWVFPLGGYYLAYLKVNGYSEEAKRDVSRQLENINAALWEGCIGQLPEIYDGGNPVSSKGCFAQAWSVGEILRVYDALRE
ncbi:MAG: glycogen debranching protein [Lachnospiraceae bacterium]|nr:glycogen debranching protein [Lachnospiraceae bacterium]